MRVYKIGNQSKIGVTIIYFNTPDLTITEHENLEKLSNKSDLVFVFNKSLGKSISFKKFSYLYNAIYYSIGENNDEALDLWGMLDYLNELETKYFSYSVILKEDLGEIEDKQIECIERLQNSIIESSVYSSETLSKEDREKIYRVPSKSWWSRVKTDNLGIYNKYKTKDKVMFLRPISISTLKDDLRKDIEPDRLATFKGSGIKVLLPSLISNNYLNLNIVDADFETIRGQSRLSQKS